MENVTKTIVVNLFAGPGAGKSTGAAYIFSLLKMAGIDAELVTEFAKDKVWEKSDPLVFKSQIHLFGEQTWRMTRCNGKVAVIVTDSPLILNSLYCDENEPWYPYFKKVIKAEFDKYINYNFFIDRRKDYNPNGRNQTYEEAQELDRILLNMLTELEVPFSRVSGDKAGYESIVQQILEIIK